jgi:Ca-activated chloride channel family protein
VILLPVPLPPIEDAPRSAAEGTLALFGDIVLADPWFLVLALFAPLLAWFAQARGGRAAGRAPALPLARPPRSWKQRLAWLGPVLYALALAGAAVALARPLRTDVSFSNVSEGVDIVLIVDRSTSMQHTDMDPAGQKDRLTVVKEVVGDFAARRMTDQVGASDSCALIGFARFPELLCPFTLDDEALRAFLDSLAIVEYGPENYTAIGVALAKGVAVLRESDAKSKVVVLLTDGENNHGEIAPQVAAEMAESEGIRVYTVLAARVKFVQDFYGRVYPSDEPIDAVELERIAEATGGRFFRAKDEDSLEEVYEEIESLERTPREERVHVEHFDLYPRLLLGSFAMYVLSWLVRATLGRRVP